MINCSSLSRKTRSQIINKVRTPTHNPKPSGPRDFAIYVVIKKFITETTTSLPKTLITL